MAYMTLLASVSSGDIANIRADPAAVVYPTQRSYVSHYFVSGPRPNNAAHLVAEALDGGLILNEDFWHPLRPPMYRDVNATQRLCETLTDEKHAPEFDALRNEEWYRLELDRLFRILFHASSEELCLVSAIERPADRQRALRVRIPWEAHSPHHGSPVTAPLWKRLLGG